MKKRTVLQLSLQMLASMALLLVTSLGFAQVEILQQESNPSQQNEISSLKSHIDYTNSSRDEKSYCIPVGDEWDYFYIEDFVFAGIENLSTGCGVNGYQDFTAMQGSVGIGETSIAKIRSTEFGGSSYLVANIWIDLDGNEVFEASELVLQDVAVNETLLEFPVTIPGNAVAGITRLRVVVSFFDLDPSADPCATLSAGEWEDYSIEITGASTGNDAKAVSIDFDYPLFEMGEVIPVATVKNEGTNTVEIPTVCTIDGTSYTSTKTTAPLASGESAQITFDAWNADTDGVFLMHVNTELVGDENATNDEITMDVTIAPYIPEKRVLVEEGTGTWCGWCVRGIVSMEHMSDTYPESWIGVSVHYGDPMANEEWINNLGFLFYPNARFMRGISADVGLEIFEESYQQEMSKIAPATLNITSTSLNSATGNISLTAESEFIFGGEGYRFSAFVIENNVTGDDSEWDQSNYYSGGGNGQMGGYELLSDPVPAADMVYNDVARKIIGDFDGVEGSLPAVVEYGETHSYTFETDIDPEWDMDNIEVVAILLNDQGMIVNAAKSDITVGIDNITDNGVEVNIYPNPARNYFTVNSESNIQQVEIYNQVGQLTKQLKTTNQQLNVSVSDFISGIYFVKIFSSNQIITRKLVIE